MRIAQAHFIAPLLFIGMLTCPGQMEIARAQEIASVADIDHHGGGSIADPCQNPSISPALRETLHLVCAKALVETANRAPQRAIIIGFVGGFVNPDDVRHPEVLFAAILRSRYGSAVQVEVFGNHEWKKAVDDTVLRLDTNKDGVLTPAEKDQLKIILYGHSWGASQTLAFARELQHRGIPVALTIQIDSVKKFGQDDRQVPDNVAKAVNFYQRKGFTPGEPLIVPADATRTTILGNFHMQYASDQVNLDNYRWLSRVFNKPHHQIENDPHIWDRIATLIDSEILQSQLTAPGQP